MEFTYWDSYENNRLLRIYLLGLLREQSWLQWYIAPIYHRVPPPPPKFVLSLTHNTFFLLCAIHLASAFTIQAC
eukprot:COSAG01_NODE_5232_length_4396_cov_3.872469_2_plen_74_part_00